MGNRAGTSFNHFFLRTDLRNLGFKAKFYDSPFLMLIPYVNIVEILFREVITANIIDVRDIHREF